VEPPTTFTLQDMIEIRDALRMSHLLMNGAERKWGVDGTIAHVSHTSEVGMLLMSAGAGRELIQAGFLHDVLEGYVPESVSELEAFVVQRFGQRVVDLIKAVTEPPKSAQPGNWWERKAAVLAELSSGDLDVATLTCAIKISTLSEGNYFLEKGGAIAGWSAGSYPDNLRLYQMYLDEFVRWNVAPALVQMYRHELGRFAFFESRQPPQSGEQLS
jgi:(p)ppGpp synthase/HD superfamily hydrolase